ncbi:hypothetical protein Pan44_28290 [Caulifigura coniformis]|uniref:Uncharacterized protein n=1 Tax=Caulifigura coniformis TaxID=2527983 RepID=A0A517SF89_9PLAN|nr:hypothetical protein [Caulifigura coniformis]QDT54791.1 hypothetical protein Pan44_28290 [Caulifigura coniformis]
MGEALTFDGFLAESSIADEGRKAETIRNVLLCGLQSLNGRSIPASAFGGAERAKALYEGVHVYLNHDMDAGISRRVESLAGIVESVTVDGLGRPRGDIRLNGNKAGEELRALFEFSQKAEKHGARLKDVGFSHVAVYTFSALDRTVVQSVDQVFSVDVVIRPATTKSFSESSQPVPMKTPQALLESLGVDLQTWSETPIEFAMNERALFDPSYNQEGDSFDPSEALSILAGHTPEGSKALASISFL